MVLINNRMFHFTALHLTPDGTCTLHIAISTLGEHTAELPFGAYALSIQQLQSQLARQCQVHIYSWCTVESAVKSKETCPRSQHNEMAYVGLQARCANHYTMCPYKLVI